MRPYKHTKAAQAQAQGKSNPNVVPIFFKSLLRLYHHPARQGKAPPCQATKGTQTEARLSLPQARALVGGRCDSLMHVFWPFPRFLQRPSRKIGERVRNSTRTRSGRHTDHTHPTLPTYTQTTQALARQQHHQRVNPGAQGSEPAGRDIARLLHVYYTPPSLTHLAWPV